MKIKLKCNDVTNHGVNGVPGVDIKPGNERFQVSIRTEDPEYFGLFRRGEINRDGDEILSIENVFYEFEINEA